MKSILIIEDNKDLNHMLKESLLNAGYEVFSEYTGIDGLEVIKRTHFDLILLDIMLPYKSGDEVLREVRLFSEIPVIIISAKDMARNKIDLLKLGADDYITKPFDLEEVEARVEAALRRCYRITEENKIFKYKDILLNDDTKEVLIDGFKIEATPKEFKLLEILIKHPGKVFTKSNLYESIWEEEYLGDENVVKTHVSNLRNKLKKGNPQEEYIETVWGLGYRLLK